MRLSDRHAGARLERAAILKKVRSLGRHDPHWSEDVAQSALKELEVWIVARRKRYEAMPEGLEGKKRKKKMVKKKGVR